MSGSKCWLPVNGWNGKFEGVGNGGYAGGISYRDLAAAVRRGYAVANRDTGHKGDNRDLSFALGHPEKALDFAFRSVHEMTVKGKAIVKAFYGSAPRFSYWSDCSTGGRQAMVEAQMYPDDYDGIVAGAPGNDTTQLGRFSEQCERIECTNFASVNMQRWDLSPSATGCSFSG